jgi:hypothetical protein
VLCAFARLSGARLGAAGAGGVRTGELVRVALLAGGRSLRATLLGGSGALA